MKIITWDSGVSWDNPNARWGEPAYLLEPGDPGYQGPIPSQSNIKRKTKMSNNALPRTLKGLLARAEDCADGAHELEDEIPLVLIRESNLRAHLQALKGDLTATPPVAGLIYLFKVAENERKAADSARALKDKEVNTFLVNTRARLALYLGSEASAAWGPTGFLNAQGNSNAVPDTQDDRLQCLATLGLYLNAHPAYEQAAGTPAPEVTHTRALALHAQLSDARSLANEIGRASCRERV